MKVYVDELPQTCLDCENVLCEHQIIEACYATRHPDCPLLSLSDYTKQVRKEVCESLKKFIKDDSIVEISNKGTFYVSVSLDKLNKLLDQITRETK